MTHPFANSTKTSRNPKTPCRRNRSFFEFTKTSQSDAARSAAYAREMRFGNVDQLLCAQAERFVGNKWSSFTHHVCYLREQRGTPKACVGSDIYGREIDPAMAYV